MLRLVFHGDDVGQEGRGAEIVERGGFGAAGGLQDERFERGDDCERALLAGDAEPDAGLDEVHREGLQPGGERGFERDLVGAEDGAGSDAVGAVGGQALEAPDAATRAAAATKAAPCSMDSR